METPTITRGSSKWVWIGWVISALPVLLLLFSATGKFLKPPPVIEGFAHLGWPDRYALPLGIVEVACTLIYLIPRTNVLGAILLTGYLGGATATHARIGEAFIFPILAGVLLWLGLYFRDPAVRQLAPFRRS